METPPDEEDRFLQERQFGIGTGIDVSDLLEEVADSFKEAPKPKPLDEEPEEDAAIGEILDPFAEDDGVGEGGQDDRGDHGGVRGREVTCRRVAEGRCHRRPDRDGEGPGRRLGGRGEGEGGE